MSIGQFRGREEIALSEELGVLVGEVSNLIDHPHVKENPMIEKAIRSVVTMLDLSWQMALHDDMVASEMGEEGQAR